MNPSVPSIPGVSSNYTLPTVFKVAAGPNKIWNGSEMQIVNFNVIGQSRNVYNASYAGGLTYELSGVRAYDCGMWFCLQARRTNVSFGIIEQGVASTWDQAINPPSRYGSSNFTKIPENFNVEPGVVYGVDGMAQQAAFTGISNLLFGTVNPDNPGEISYFGANNGYLDGLKGLWYAADNIDGWMGNLTQSLSNDVRLTGTTKQLNSTLYYGVAWAEEAYIKVQWLWIIYPSALVVMSIGFLFITIVENRTQRPWKNYPTAMLYTRLDDRLQEAAAKADAQNRTLTDDFDRMAVRLHTDDWTFRPASVR